MNKDLFYDSIKSPDKLTPEAIANLAEAVQRYPYFHAGWMLLIKGLANKGSINFADELRRASVHVWDRAALFWLVRGRMPVFLPRKAAPARKPAPAEPAEPKVDSIPDALPDSAIISSPSESIAVPIASDNTSAIPGQSTADVASDSPSLASPLMVSIVAPVGGDYFGDDDDLLDDPSSKPAYSIDDIDGNDHFCRPDGRYTFDDWLEMVSHMPTSDLSPKDITKQKNDSLIDKFLQGAGADGADKYVIKPPKPDKSSKTAPTPPPASTEDDQPAEGGIFTETLASVYVKQNKFDKALNIYKRLSLKNPEKSDYFASRISELEQKIKDSGSKSE